MLAREQEINERFNQSERTRFDLEKRITKMIEDKTYSV